MRVASRSQMSFSLVEKIRRRRSDRGKHPRVLGGRLDDRHELVREELEALGRKRGEGGHRPLSQDLRFAEHPVEDRAFHLFEWTGQTAERTRRVDPHERLRMEQQRLENPGGSFR